MKSQAAKLFITNDTDALFLRLEKRVFDENSSFKQLIVVPSSSMKEVVERKLVESGIFCGVKILELSQAVDYLIRLFRFDEKKGHSFAAPMLFSLHMEKMIEESMDSKDPFFDPLKSYICPLDQAHQKERKIREISEALSIDFLNYGVYASSALELWLKNKSWQTSLWESLFSIWDYPQRALPDIYYKVSDKQVEVDIHLFGFSFIPKVYHDFFISLGASLNVFYYYLSPSANFFGENLSDRKVAFLKKSAANSEKKLELEDYKKSQNRLISNFGAQTKLFFNSLIDQDFDVEEFFYQDQKYQNETLLSYIKQSLFNNENFKEKKDLSIKEDSFQIHKCFSKKLEVESLCKTLMHLAQTTEINPSDVLVVAPDISIYYPYIKQIFGEQSPFPFEVEGLEIKSQSSFLRGFWSLLSIYESRFEPHDVFSLLQTESLLKKFGIDPLDIPKIKLWCEKAHILWGINKEQKVEILTKGSSELESFPISEQGTWLYGLHLLLNSFFVLETDKSLEGASSFYPISAPDFSDAQLLGNFISFIDKLLKFKNQILHEKKEIKEWVCFMHLLEKEFFCSSCLQKDEGYHFFKSQLKTLDQLSLKTKEYKYGFLSIKRFFEKTFSKKGGCVSSYNKNSILFSSLGPQKIVPKKVICYLGMDEESFPSKKPLHPLREIPKEQMDPHPSLIEEERAMLLDGLICAEQALIFSYTCFDDSDGKEKEASFLLRELLENLDDQFTIEKQKVSSKVIYKHKTFSFHEQELLVQRGYFSQRDYHLATALYKEQKKEKKFLPEFYSGSFEKLDEIHDGQTYEALLLSELQKFARNPLRHYLNSSLDIYLKKEITVDEKTEKEFILSPFIKKDLKQSSLSGALQDEFLKMKLQGATPYGVFSEIAFDIVDQESKELASLYQAIQIDPKDLFSIILDRKCKEKKVDSISNKIVPSLLVNVQDNLSFIIEGKLERICEKGMIIEAKSSFEEVIKIWPIYLLFILICQRDFEGEIEPNLIFLKDKKKLVLPSFCVKNSFSKYLTYFQRAQSSPSPLMPIWAKSFLEEDKDILAKEIEKPFITSSNFTFFDEYQKWCFSHLEPFCFETMDRNWGEIYATTFDGISKWIEEGKSNV